MFELVGFEADDTLRRSQDYFDDAQARFEAVVGNYVDLAAARLHERTLATERRNIKLFGYGVKGMVLSMIETAVAITDARISASDIHRLVELGKEILQHTVELLPGIRDAEIGRAPVCTPVTNAHLVCSLLLEKKKTTQ